MSQLAVAKRASSNEPSVEQLEDALYDIVATGVDPGAAPGALQAVQALLHEHARKRKSSAELLAFFEAYGLPLVSERLPGAVLPVALPPLPQHASMAGGMPPTAAMQGSLVGFPAPGAQPRIWVWALAACALVGFGAAIGLGYSTVTAMRDELQNVRVQAASSAQTLQRVQSEAESLRGGLRENAALVRSVDKKSDLLIRSLLSPIDPAKTQ
jgi:hypothetical protein